MTYLVSLRRVRYFINKVMAESEEPFVRNVAKDKGEGEFARSWKYKESLYAEARRGGAGRGERESVNAIRSM